MYVCKDCGRTTESSDTDFCHYCGSKNGFELTQTEVPEGYQAMTAKGGAILYANTKMIRLIPLSLILAFVPGLFDIYGLGHLVIKKWGKGTMFLALSGFYYYLNYWSGLDMLQPYLFILSLAIFVWQMVDLYRSFRMVLNDAIL